MKIVVCPECGKEFIYNPQSIFFITYKDKKIHLCGYTCKNKHKQRLGIKEVNRIR